MVFFQIMSDFENNKFIEGLKFSDSGTLTEEFKDNDLLRLQFMSSYHQKLPFYDKGTISLKTNLDI